jgi:uncharacterized protein YxjI
MSTETVALLRSQNELYVRQSHEMAELFGFETRNKYGVFTQDQRQVAFAAEQSKGILGFLMRQVLGHWRPFELHFFDVQRNLLLRAVHPFRFWFQRLEVFTAEGRYVGALQQRFSILSKKFDLEGSQGQVQLSVNSGLFRLWTFPFLRDGQEQAVIEKKWSGGLTELFTDKDNFRIRFTSALTDDERLLVLAAALFVDLQYFEKKAR